VVAIDARAGARSISVELTPEEIALRLSKREVNAGVAHRGLLEKYALTVRPAHQGAVTHSGAVTWLRDES
jgi:dihydroxy-acid dehydratase